MPTLEYYVDGKLHKLSCQTGETLLKPTPKSKSAGAKKAASAKRAVATMALGALERQADRVSPMFVGARGESSTLIVMPKSGVGAIVIPTATMIVDGATKSERKKLLGEGLEVITEGEEGKLLLRGQLEGIAGIQRIAELARDAVERGNVKSAHPNFMRVPLKVKPSAAGNQPLWHQSNDGNPGIIGADVAAHAAWTITRGNGNIRVAVLDEGVDPSHPALSSAIVDQKDFVDGNPTAMPDGDDAHGTACAGIICARSTSFPGLANECSLIGVRIAKGDGNDGWIFDDFQTADAIDWSWKVAKADVLSNSWGGGAPSPAITNAFQRAQLKGRGNKGCIIVIASGNENSSVGYPGTLPFVLTVGATTPFDVRQSPTAKGGENWWGSNFGPELDIVAPGVKIATTDIRGAAGYQNGDFTKTFNGTSSATPIVAAAAALILSVRPDLKESRVREILQATADRLTVNGGRNNEVGWGRVNLYTALRLARRT